MRRVFPLLLTLAVVVAACDSQAPDLAPEAPDAPRVELLVTPPAPAASKKGDKAAGDDPRAAALLAYIEAANADLAARGLDVAIAKAEWVGETPDAAGTVIAEDRTLRLDAQFVPGDPRRGAVDNSVTHVVDQSFAAANAFNPLPPFDAEPAIDASFDTWNAVNCSKLDIVKLPDAGGTNYSFLLFTGEPVDFFYADISTVGFLPGGLFDAVLGPGASSSVIGVTFTFVWVSGGEPTDVNGDGYDDVAIKEVWYNDAFPWSTDGTYVDVETIALHENGHALGLGHFGKVFIKNNGTLQTSPRAVMNAVALGDLRTPLGTDNGAFCGLYAAWPN